MTRSRLGLRLCTALSFLTACSEAPREDAAGPQHVYPGDDLQAAVERAAQAVGDKRVIVHAGTYAPRRHGQAMVWLTARHDGVELLAEGEVILTAANPELARPTDAGFPAVVNHVVYLGDGITSRTRVRGFRITGASNFVTMEEGPDPIQPDIAAPRLDKQGFFYTDGGAVKVFGRSYPVLEDLVVYDNYASPCGAGISIEHRGYQENAAVVRRCVFRGNRSPLTGPALDVLENSSAVVEDCLFVGNLSSCPLDDRSRFLGVWKAEHGSGALTVFPGSKVVVRRCTFTGNRNGVDDSSTGSIYEQCIFWRNDVPGGWPPGERYELDLRDGQGVRRCAINGVVLDLRGVVPAESNLLGCADPQFDAAFVPHAPGFEELGYRP